MVTAELVCGSCGAAHEMGRTKQVGSDIWFDIVDMFNGALMPPCPMCEKTAWSIHIREWQAKPLPAPITKAIIEQAYRI